MASRRARVAFLQSRRERARSAPQRETLRRSIRSARRPRALARPRSGNRPSRLSAAPAGGRHARAGGMAGTVCAAGRAVASTSGASRRLWTCWPRRAIRSVATDAPGGLAAGRGIRGPVGAVVPWCGGAFGWRRCPQSSSQPGRRCRSDTRRLDRPRSGFSRARARATLEKRLALTRRRRPFDGSRSRTFTGRRHCLAAPASGAWSAGAAGSGGRRSRGPCRDHGVCGVWP